MALFPKQANTLPRTGLPNKFNNKAEEDWALAQLIRQEKKWGTVEECGDEDVDHISGVRCIPKELGGDNVERWYRLVIRMCALNERFGTRKFKIEILKQVLDVDTRGWWGGTIDIRKAYMHLKLTKEARRWCGVRVKGRTFRFKALPFGWKLSPWIFCALTKKVIEAWRQDEEFIAAGAIVVCFYDDFLILGPDKEVVERLLKRARADLVKLGFLINEPKSDDRASQTVVFTGYQLRLDEGRVSLRPGRATRYAWLTKRATATWAARKGKTGQAWTDRTMMQRLLGKLNHAAGIHKSLKPYLRSAFNDLNQRRKGPVRISWEAIHDLERVARDLPKLDGKGEVIWRPQLGAVIEIRTDASGLVGGGWGAVCEEKGIRGGARWKDPEWDRGATVALKELRACRRTLEEWGPEFRGRRVLFRTDSKTVMYMWKRGGAKRHNRLAYAREFKEIVQLARKHDIALDDAMWIPREFNVVADELSKLHVGQPVWARRRVRWDEGFRSEDWETPEEWVERIEAELGEVTVDAFASGRTAKANVFYGPTGTLGAVGGAIEDAASVWSDRNQVVWAAPPLRLVPQTVRLASESDAGVGLVVPKWQGRAWWNRLCRDPRWMMVAEAPSEVMGDWVESELADRKWVMTLWKRTPTSF